MEIVFVNEDLGGIWLTRTIEERQFFFLSNKLLEKVWQLAEAPALQNRLFSVAFFFLWFALGIFWGYLVYFDTMLPSQVPLFANATNRINNR